MDIRTAILKAADHIERNPETYSFHSNDKPDCGTPGCMLGWVGVFLDVPARESAYTGSYMNRTAMALGLQGMGDFLRFCEGYSNRKKLYGFTHDASEAATLLRAFATERIAAVKSTIPTSVRAIFATRQEDPDRVAA